MTSAAVAYREREVLTAAPGRLVVIVFDHLLVNLRRARIRDGREQRSSCGPSPSPRPARPRWSCS